MKLRLLLLTGMVVVPAFGGTSDTTTITLTGKADPVCHVGSPSDIALNVGMLVNLSDGTLAPITSQPVKIEGSWCNTGSKIGILATPLVAQGAPPPPPGWTKAVNYTATATGWGSATPSFTTTADSSGGGSGTTPVQQTVGDPTAATITVNVSGFATPSAGDRLVANSNYSGQISVTLTVGS